MLPNLPLDVDGKQIRVGDKVIFGADNGSFLFVGTVFKITPCFVWMKTKNGGGSWRREASRVGIIK